MKSKEEIEAYLGIKIKSSKEEQTRDSSYAMSNDVTRYVSKEQQYYTVTVKVLSKESEKALKNLLKESIDKGDLETASTCHTILMEESTFYKNHPNAIGLDINEGIALNKYEEERARSKRKSGRTSKIKSRARGKRKSRRTSKIKSRTRNKRKSGRTSKIKSRARGKRKSRRTGKIKSRARGRRKSRRTSKIKSKTRRKRKTRINRQRYY